MDSSSDSGRGSGQDSSGGNRRNRSGNRNRNRNRSRNRSGDRDGQRRRSNSRSSGDYRPRGDGSRKAEPPKKTGLFSKIVGFFTGDDAAGNKGTGRPIQTERKRPGGAGESQPASSATGGKGSSSSSRPPRDSGDRPKRQRSRRGKGSGGGGEREGGRGRGPRREASADSRDENDRRPREKRQPRIVEVSSGRLYVGNLVYEVSEEDLHDLFKGFGTVVSAEIVTNSRNQQSKGFAFVEMGNIDEAKRAVEILHDKDFMGRKLVVTGAKSDGPVESRTDSSEQEPAKEPEAEADDTGASDEPAAETAEPAETVEPAEPATGEAAADQVGDAAGESVDEPKKPVAE